MKVLHVITSLQIGGAEKLVAEIVPMLEEKLRADSLELREEDVQIDVVAFDNSEPNFSKLLTNKGINVTFFGKGYYKPSFLFRLCRMMKDYDIVHTHNTSPQYFAAIASLWARKPKLVYTEHNTSNRMRTIPGFSLFLKWVYSKYDKNICISDKAEENLREYLSRGSNSKVQGSKWDEKICTIYNGVNVQKFHDAKPIEGLRPDGKTVVVMVAAFRPQKDQDTLIKAMRHLSEDKYELWIVGDGKRRAELENLAESLELRAYSLETLADEDAADETKTGKTPQQMMSPMGFDADTCPSESSCEHGTSEEQVSSSICVANSSSTEAINKKNSSTVNDDNDDQGTRILETRNSGTCNIKQYGNIKFLGIRSDIPEILHTADIVVMSSHYEGLSLSSVEGMSVGKPFIASDVDGLHEVVEGYGVLVPHKDDVALADVIERLASDKSYYQQVAGRCWERAQMFDIDKMVEGYQKVYMGLFESL